MHARRLAPAVVALSLAACAERQIAAPDPTPDVAAGAQTPPATTAGAPAATAAGADTSSQGQLPASVRVHGRVLVTTYDGPRAPGDTLASFAPLPSARLTLYRNVLVDGRGVSQKVGEQTTGADGAFAFDGVPGGYYVLSLDVTAARPYGDAYMYIAGTRPDVSADLRVWHTAP